MLRYADAIVKRGVDKLIDAIGQSPEPQTKNAETPQPQKSMDNDTDCAPQTTGNTTNRGLTEQVFSLMDELCDFRYNVLDRTPEVQRRDQTDKGGVHCRGSGGLMVCNKGKDGQRRSSLPWFWGVNWCSCKCRADAAARLHCTA